MKCAYILVIVFFVISLSAFSQKRVPENVKKEFAAKYTSAQSVKWDSEETDEWEAEFNLNGKKMSASFDNSGRWIETETVISEKELPEVVVNTLKKDFQGYKKGPIEIYESPEMKGYEMSLKKGEKSWEVIFSDKGVLLKKTGIKEEIEKNEKN